jgi:hypothetical protein
MNKTITKTITLIWVLCFSLNLGANEADENFCFNGDIPEAQMDFSMMCLTAPVLFCPPTYFGCPSDNVDPSVIGFPTVTPGDPNCPTPIVTFTDDVTTNTPCLRIVHRTWDATYPAGSASIKLHSSCQQTLFLEDIEAPVINNCPSDITIDLTNNCDSTAIWFVPTVTENCELRSFLTTHFSGETFPTGVTPVTYTAEDQCGLTTECSFTVSVVGSCCTMPTISCPPMAETCPVTGSIDPSVIGTATAIPTDPSCGNPVITFQDNIVSSGPCNGEMLINRLWTATDASDNTQTSTCTQTVQVRDDIPPVLSNIPNDITVSGNGQGCDVQVFWSQPTSSDNCGVASMTSNFDSGSFFQAGTTTITYTVLDNCGLSASGSFEVTVNCLCDADPVLTCPSNFTDCPSGSFPEPSFSGMATAVAGSALCSDPIVTFSDQIISNGPCAAEYEIVRTWTATNPSDPTLITSCDQTISLTDNGGPTITNVPTDITLFKKGSHCALPFTWTEPTYTDDCTLASSGSNIANGSDFVGGTTTVVFTAVDVCGNVATASFNVTVECNSCNAAPSITCPPAFTSCIGGFIPSPSISGEPNIMEQGGTCGPAFVFHSDAITGFGNCAGSFFVDRTWTVIDEFNPGLSASCVQQISINDNTAPVISGTPANISVVGTTNGCQLSVNWVAPTVTDDCGIDSFVSSHNPADVFPEGTTTVTYTATDNCGNVSTSSFDITVTCQACNTLPTITCPVNVVLCPGSSTDPAITGFASGNISGSNCSGAPNITFSDVIVTNITCNQTIERTWTATNPSDSNLSVSCVQVIQLVDTTAPVFTSFPTNISVSGTGNNCTANATWAVPVVSDACGNVTLTSSHNSGSLFSQGTTTVTYTATDGCGNTVSGSFVITVSCATCNTLPTITCPANYVACPGTSSDPALTGFATGNISGPNCTGSPIVTFSDLNPTSTACPSAEFIERTWTATNPSNPNLVSTCIQTIQLVDNTPPVFTFVPSNIFVTADGASCEAVIPWSPAIATDNCGNVNLTVSHPSGSTFSEGQTIVIFTATDGCGNATTASFTITVSCGACSTLPTISCPADYTACPGTSSDPAVTGFATGNISGPNCSGSPIVTFNDLNPTNSACIGVAFIERTWTATNPSDANLSATCVQLISLVDQDAPVISGIPNNITVNGSGTACQVNVSWVEPTATDNCNLTFFEGTHSNGSLFSEGTTTVSYTANDGCGNTVNESFTVTVLCAAACNSLPSLTCPADYRTCPVSGVPAPSVSGIPFATAGSSICESPVVTFADAIVSTGPCPTAKVVDRTWIAKDPNNSSLVVTCVQRITLEDVQAPVFVSCPTDITIMGTPNTGSGSGCIGVPTWVLPVVTDNCSNVTLQAQNQNGQVVQIGDTFQQGTTQVVYTATDACGNTSSCQFDVTVTCDSNSGNLLTCQNDIVVPCEGNGGAVVNFLPPSFSGSCGTCDGSNIPGFVYMGSFGGSEYYCSLNTATWADANTICENNGGFLACIGSEEENAFLANLLTLQSAWIGLNDLDMNGEFTWGCGDAFDYSNWFPGQPNNFNGNQQCVEMLNNGQWNDQYPYYLLEFILEKPCSFVNQIAGPTSGSFLPAGEYTVTYETNDICGPIETCSFNITVEDGMSIECPEDIYVSALSTSAGVPVTWSIPEVSSCCSNCSQGDFIPGFVYMGSFNGHHYYCSTVQHTWDVAQANCIANGGNLAVINSAAENTFLANLLTLQSAWIGASDVAVEGTFDWVNGDPFSYTNWYPGQPNNYGGNQHFVEMLNNGQWNDQYGFYGLEYIMEIESCLSIVQTGGPAPGSILPPGTNTTVTYTSTDGCGNSQSCSFNVLVESIEVVCNPRGLNSECHYIDQTVLGNVTTLSGDNNGFAYFEDDCIEVDPGQSIPIKLTPGFGTCPIEKVFWSVWVDYNLDKDFDDAGEFVAYGCGMNTLSGIITIPNNVGNGPSVMRVIMSAGEYVDNPCDVYPLGETEDYCIYLNETKSTPIGITSVSKANEADPIVLQNEDIQDLAQVAEYDMHIFPNPVSEVLTIETETLEYVSDIKLYGPNGALAQDIRYDKKDKFVQVNVSEYTSGMYTVTMIYNDGKVLAKKVIIQN